MSEKSGSLVYFDLLYFCHKTTYKDKYIVLVSFIDGNVSRLFHYSKVYIQCNLYFGLLQYFPEQMVLYWYKAWRFTTLLSFDKHEVCHSSKQNNKTPHHHQQQKQQHNGDNKTCHCRNTILLPVTNMKIKFLMTDLFLHRMVRDNTFKLLCFWNFKSLYVNNSTPSCVST